MGTPVEVGGHHLPRPAEPRDLRDEKADRAAAEDSHAVAAADVREVHGVEGDAQRLEKCAVRLGEFGGEGNEAALRPGHPFAKASVGLPVSREADLLAEVRVPLEAEGAGLARDGGIDGHPPAVFGHSRELVAEDQGPCEGGLADRPLAEPMKVRAAESHRTDPHEGLPRPRLRPFLLMQAQVSSAVQPQDAH